MSGREAQQRKNNSRQRVNLVYFSAQCPASTAFFHVFLANTNMKTFPAIRADCAPVPTRQRDGKAIVKLAHRAGIGSIMMGS